MALDLTGTISSSDRYVYVTIKHIDANIFIQVYGDSTLGDPGVRAIRIDTDSTITEGTPTIFTGGQNLIGDVVIHSATEFTYLYYQDTTQYLMGVFCTLNPDLTITAGTSYALISGVGVGAASEPVGDYEFILTQGAQTNLPFRYISVDPLTGVITVENSYSWSIETYLGQRLAFFSSTDALRKYDDGKLIYSSSDGGIENRSTLSVIEYDTALKTITPPSLKYTLLIKPELAPFKSGAIGYDSSQTTYPKTFLWDTTVDATLAKDFYSFEIDATDAVTVDTAGKYTQSDSGNHIMGTNDFFDGVYNNFNNLNNLELLQDISGTVSVLDTVVLKNDSTLQLKQDIEFSGVYGLAIVYDAGSTVYYVVKKVIPTLLIQLTADNTTESDINLYLDATIELTADISTEIDIQLYSELLISLIEDTTTETDISLYPIFMNSLTADISTETDINLLGDFTIQLTAETDSDITITVLIIPAYIGKQLYGNSTITVSASGGSSIKTTIYENSYIK